MQPNCKQKEMCMYYYLLHEKSGDVQLMSNVKEQLYSNYLETVFDEEVLRHVYEVLRHVYNEKNPVYLLAMSKNIFTPIDILMEMTKIKGIEKGAMIRKNSLQTLQILQS